MSRRKAAFAWENQIRRRLRSSGEPDESMLPANGRKVDTSENGMRSLWPLWPWTTSPACSSPSAANSPRTASRHIDSSVGFVGRAKKGFILTVVPVATLLDKTLATDAMVFQTATACYYIANGGISIPENAGIMGLPVPRAMREALKRLREKDEKKE